MRMWGPEPLSPLDMSEREGWGARGTKPRGASWGALSLAPGHWGDMGGSQPGSGEVGQVLAQPVAAVLGRLPSTVHPSRAGRGLCSLL